MNWSVDCTKLTICRFVDDSSSVIELDQQDQEVDSWKILPLTPPQVQVLCIVLFELHKMIQISKAAIKYYQVGRTIPHCGFELELLSEQVQRLRHKVVIKGVPSPNSFHIRYPQPEGDKATAGNYQA